MRQSGSENRKWGGCGTPRQNAFAAALFVVALFAGSEACIVPVFRYALERWTSDVYEVIVFHDSTITAEDSSRIAEIASVSRGVASRLDLRAVPKKTTANVRLMTIDVRDSLSSWQRRILEGLGEVDYPWAVVSFPVDSRLADHLWDGPLHALPLRTLVDSPLRKEISRRILDGETSVWVMIESPDKGKNRKVAKELNKHLKKAEEVVELPDVTAEEAPDWYDPESGPQLRVDFSVVRLSRDDPSERLFLAMLLRVEPDLLDVTEPILVPIYGRARALTALVGDKLTENDVLDVCRFMSGPCSCVIKADNPGIDLLTDTDWDRRIVQVIADQPPPELVGLSEMVEMAQKEKREGERKEAVPAEAKKAEPAVAAPPARTLREDDAKTVDTESGGNGAEAGATPDQDGEEPATDTIIPAVAPGSEVADTDTSATFVLHAGEPEPHGTERSGSMLLWTLFGTVGAVVLVVLVAGVVVMRRGRRA